MAQVVDKYEYNTRIDKIKKHYLKQNYAAAVKLADDMDFKNLKEWKTIALLINLYEAVGRLKDVRYFCVLAYNRNLGGKKLVYKLARVCIMLGELEEAEDLYEEYSRIAGNDGRRLELKYELRKAQSADITELIDILNELAELDFDEKYGYILAYLYSRNKKYEKCVEVCDRVIDTFVEGEYVDKARELKSFYVGVNKAETDSDEGGIDHATTKVFRGKKPYAPQKPEYAEPQKPNPAVENARQNVQQVIDDAKQTVESTYNELKKESEIDDISTKVSESGSVTGKYDTKSLQDAVAKGVSDVYDAVKAEDVFRVNTDSSEDDEQEYEASEETYAKERHLEETYSENAHIENAHAENVYKENAHTEYVYSDDDAQNGYENIAEDEENSSYEQKTIADVHGEPAYAQKTTAGVHEKSSYEQENASDVYEKSAYEQKAVADVREKSAYEQKPTSDVHEKSAYAQQEAYALHEDIKNVPAGEDIEFLDDSEPIDVPEQIQPEVEETFDGQETEGYLDDTAAEDEDVKEAMDMVAAALASQVQEEMEDDTDILKPSIDDNPPDKIYIDAKKAESRPEKKAEKKTHATGSKKAETADESEAASLPLEIRRYFVKYSNINGLVEQVADFINCVTGEESEAKMGTSCVGNLIVSGNRSADKRQLAISIVQALNELNSDQKRKIATTTGESINQRGIAKFIGKVLGKVLIIEEAGCLDKKRVDELLKIMRDDTEEMLVILIDSENEINILLKNNPEITEVFNHRIVYKQYNVNELVEMCKRYADKNNFIIDDKAMFMLYTTLNEIHAREEGVNLEEVRAVVDGAIDRAEKRAGKLFFGGVKKKKIDDKEYYILIESDFKQQ